MRNLPSTRDQTASARIHPGGAPAHWHTEPRRAAERDLWSATFQRAKLAPRDVLAIELRKRIAPLELRLNGNRSADLRGRIVALHVVLDTMERFANECDPAIRWFLREDAYEALLRDRARDHDTDGPNQLVRKSGTAQ